MAETLNCEVFETDWPRNITGLEIPNSHMAGKYSGVLLVLLLFFILLCNHYGCHSLLNRAEGNVCLIW